MEFDDIESWLEYGFLKGWATAPTCSIHDGIGTTQAEEAEFEEGGDPCIHVIRLYADDRERLEVEANTPFVVWRASNRGWLLR